MYIGSDRLFVRLSIPRRIPTLLHRPGCDLGEWQGFPLVVQYLADLQLVHGFCCYDSIARKAKCQRVLVLAMCLHGFVIIQFLRCSQYTCEWQLLGLILNQNACRQRGTDDRRVTR